MTHATATSPPEPLEPSLTHDAFQNAWPQTPIAGMRSLRDTQGRKKGRFAGAAEACSVRSAPSTPAYERCCARSQTANETEVLSCSRLPLVTLL